MCTPMFASGFGLDLITHDVSFSESSCFSRVLYGGERSTDYYSRASLCVRLFIGYLSDSLQGRKSTSCLYRLGVCVNGLVLLICIVYGNRFRFRANAIIRIVMAFKTIRS